MLITVDNKWTYNCEFAVGIGDKVKLPNKQGLGYWIGVVTALESTGYTGSVKSVVAIEEKATGKKPTMYRSLDDDWQVSNLE